MKLIKGERMKKILGQKLEQQALQEFEFFKLKFAKCLRSFVEGSMDANSIVKCLNGERLLFQIYGNAAIEGYVKEWVERQGYAVTFDGWVNIYMVA